MNQTSRTGPLGLPAPLFVRLVGMRGARTVVATLPVDVPMVVCVGFTGFPFRPDGWHYLVELLRQYDRDQELCVEESVLRRFHDRFQPDSSSHLVLDHEPSVRFRTPLGILPWGSFRKGFGLNGSLPKDWVRSRWRGPSPAEVVSDEFRRFTDVYESIKRRGYTPWRDGFAGGTFLRKLTGEFRYVVLQGNHRVAAMSHLGYRSVTMRAVRGRHVIIDEVDAPHWHYVRTGACTLEDAIAYFNAYFRLDGFEQAARFRLWTDEDQ